MGSIARVYPAGAAHRVNVNWPTGVWGSTTPVIPDPSFVPPTESGYSTASHSTQRGTAPVGGGSSWRRQGILCASPSTPPTLRQGDLPPVPGASNTPDKVVAFFKCYGEVPNPKNPEELARWYGTIISHDLFIFDQWLSDFLSKRASPVYSEIVRNLRGAKVTGDYRPLIEKLSNLNEHQYSNDPLKGLLDRLIEYHLGPLPEDEDTIADFLYTKIKDKERTEVVDRMVSERIGDNTFWGGDIRYCLARAMFPGPFGFSSSNANPPIGKPEGGPFRSLARSADSPFRLEQRPSHLPERPSSYGHERGQQKEWACLIRIISPEDVEGGKPTGILGTLPLSLDKLFAKTVTDHPLEITFVNPASTESVEKVLKKLLGGHRDQDHCAFEGDRVRIVAKRSREEGGTTFYTTVLVADYQVQKTADGGRCLVFSDEARDPRYSDIIATPFKP